MRVWLRLLLPLVAMSATGAVHAVKSQARASGQSVDRDRIRVAVSRFAGAIKRDEVLGAVLLVTQGERALVDEAFGYRDAAKTVPMTRDTLFQMASNTKALTAAAVLSLVDAGKLDAKGTIDEDALVASGLRVVRGVLPVAEVGVGDVGDAERSWHGPGPHIHGPVPRLSQGGPGSGAIVVRR